MITAADFKKQIAKPFGQEMRRHGFKGTGFNYYQEQVIFCLPSILNLQDGAAPDVQ